MEGAYESDRFRNADGPGAKVAVYNAMMVEAAATRTTADWMKVCAENSIPVMVANQVADVVNDPQLSQTLFETRHIEGEGHYRAMRPGLRFSKTPASIRRDPPSIGRDTVEVLEELGMTEQELAS